MDDAALNRLLASVADEDRVDWSAELEAFAGDERAFLRSLQVVDEIARFHRDPAEWDRPVLDAGTRLGDYELRQLLGRGSYGDVYLAWDRRLEREVAIKLIDDARWRDDSAGAPRYLEEARRLARVKSAQVVSIHQADVLTLPNGHVAAMLVMEHIRGETLLDWARAHGRLGPREVVVLGIELCRAAAAVHAVGLVHRDIKPQNVMRAEGGRIVLMDFGPHGGTPLTMSPESFRSPGAHHATAADDLYAIGVLLFYLASGRYPVEGATLGEIAASHAAGRRTRLADLRPELPRALTQLIERVLSPSERPSTAAQLEQELERALRAPSVSTRWRAPLAGLALAAVVVTIVIIARARPPRTEETSNTTPSATSAAIGDRYTIRASLHAGRAQRRALHTGDAIAPGDSLSLLLSTSRPLYLYVIDQDERGEAYLLFPARAFPLANPLPAAERLALPGSRGGRALYWQVTSAGGKESFFFVASPHRLEAFERQLVALETPEENRAPIAPRVDDTLAELLRGVGGVATDAPGTGPRIPSELPTKATPLSNEEEACDGVWIRRLDLANPPH